MNDNDLEILTAENNAEMLPHEEFFIPTFTPPDRTSEQYRKENAERIAFWRDHVRPDVYLMPGRKRSTISPYVPS